MSIKEFMVRFDAETLSLIFGAIAGSYRTIREMMEVLEGDQPSKEQIIEALQREKEARDEIIERLRSL